MSSTSSIIEELNKIQMEEEQESVSKRPPPFATLRSNAIEDHPAGPDEGNQLTDLCSPVILSRQSDCSSGRDSVVSLKHYDCLLGELRCPGCARPMNAPIHLCKSGHSVCELCTKTLTGCPLCNDELTEIRSVTLEALAAKAYFSCKYAQHGCAVRLPNNLMQWHKERCVYQVGDCFMGKVWDGCSWSGCEIDWMKHCTDFHSDKLFNESDALLTWNYPLNVRNLKPVLAFYIFQAFNETFNLYHVYDRPSAFSKWTMVCASKKDCKTHQNFAFQVELFLPSDPSRLLVQRHSCHGERDEDVLEEARCVCIGMGDVMRFMGEDKVLHYRVKIIDLRTLTDCYPAKLVKNGCDTCVPEKKKLLETPACDVECTNYKKVPLENIIKRKSDPGKMIATIDEEEFDCEMERKPLVKCSTNGAIVVHDHHTNSVYSVYGSKNDINGKSISTATTIDQTSNIDIHKNAAPSFEIIAESPESRKNSLIKEFSGYDSMKRILGKSLSLDRSNGSTNKMQKPPRKFLTLSANLKKSEETEFDLMAMKNRKNKDDSDLIECCSLPDHIPTTPPPKKTPKKSYSIINLVRSNLKF